jgi:DnaJ-class molecular chaperone
MRVVYWCYCREGWSREDYGTKCPACGKEVRLGVRAGTPLPRPKKRDKRRGDRLEGVDELAGQTCPECKGTGRGVKPERFGYRLSNAGHWEKFCPACNGTGKCPQHSKT